MTVPILGQTPTGVCIVCKGQLTPDHEHVYIDKAELNYMLNVISGAAERGCLGVDEKGTAYFMHPLLQPPFMWHPVPMTNVGPHDECTVSIPHHHCEEVVKGRNDEIPDGNVGAANSEGHEG